MPLCKSTQAAQPAATAHFQDSRMDYELTMPGFACKLARPAAIALFLRLGAEFTLKLP